MQPSRKKPKALNWQEQRKIDRERKQQEEDEKTLANIEAPIPQSNIGFRLLKQMGYTPGTALGKEGAGRAEPVKVDIRRSRAGIGREDPSKEKRKREEMRSVEEKRNEESLMEEFGTRKKSQWRIRRVVVNFNKAKAVLEQLENKEVVPVEKEEDEEEEGGEEEEELITEEVCFLTFFYSKLGLVKSILRLMSKTMFGRNRADCWMILIIVIQIETDIEFQ